MLHLKIEITKDGMVFLSVPVENNLHYKWR